MQKAKILDDLSEIKKVDRSGMLSFCVNAAIHYEEAAKLAKRTSLSYPKPKTIIVAGMGGSAISGELLKDLAREKITVPIEVCREYSLPVYADEKTLVFIISYSGETEESLSVYLDAFKRGCMIACIGSGGALQKFAEKMKVPYLKVPSSMAPRAALPYLFVPLPIFLEKIGLVSGVESEISEAVNVLSNLGAVNSPDKPLKENFSKKLAVDICGTVPVIYGFGVYRAVAQRLKQQFNENSKVPSKWEAFPELNHNEIVGWESSGEFAKLFSIIFLRDSEEPEAIRERITITQELIRRESIKTFEICGMGKSNLAKMSSAICIGDFLTVYLAILRGVDPTPVKTITALKKKMEHVNIKGKVISELQKLTK
ncbi:MAG: bifunctional phosphoglucose/phosphomannose isomerase [Candidatus Bathyarchaeia archaeon]|nr:MAG: bifunctional phosphoglucose/phosphomannose isomerase [Candidatus Bathyarchaeota archaeon]